MPNYFDEFVVPKQPETAQPTPQPTAQPVDYFAEFTPQLEAQDTLEADISSGEWTARDSLNGARMFLQGMTSGFSDEIGLGIAAYAVAATNSDLPDFIKKNPAMLPVTAAYTTLTSAGDIAKIYREMKQEYQAEEAQFKEENKGAALGLEVAGAFASPITYIGGAPTTLGKIAARGAAEGALYGAGTSATTDDMLSRAVSGGLAGAITGGAVGGLGWLFNKATSRKIAAPLEDEAGNFIPITLAADKKKDGAEVFLHSLYKDVVGPAFGAKGIIRAQEEQVIAPLVLKQSRRKELLDKIKDRSDKAITAANVQMKNSIDKIGQQTQAAKSVVKEGTETAEEAIKGKYDPLLGKEGAVMSKAMKEIDDNLETANAGFRLAAFDSSLPAGTPKAQLQMVLDAPNPNVAMQRLDALWTDFGFQSLKNRSFRINPTQLQNDMVRKIQQDPTYELLATSKGEIKAALGNALSFVESKTRKGGYIDGNDLTTIRNSLGTAAAAKSDAGGNQALLQSLYRDVQSSIDDIMEKQLSGKGLAQFKADRAAWKSNTILRDAVTSTSKKTGQYGRFNPDDWIGAIARNSPRDARRGTGPLRTEAEGFAAVIALSLLSFIL